MQLAIMALFTTPAAFAGYNVVLGLTPIGAVHGGWRKTVAVIGAAIVAAAALGRIAPALVLMHDLPRAA